MTLFEAAVIILLALSLCLNIYCAVRAGRRDNGARLQRLKSDVTGETEKQIRNVLDYIDRQSREESARNAEFQNAFVQSESRRFTRLSASVKDGMDSLRKTVSDMTDRSDKRFAVFQKQVGEGLALMRADVEKDVAAMQASNEKHLEEIRRTVDEKLQKTLDERISQSFKSVSERLEQVYMSLGEMQKVGRGVDDLKRVLSNVKTRGILGEVRLGSIMEDVMSPGQYETDIATKRGSRDRVEYAVKLPGADGGYVYLPIDAKFPLDAYQKLLDAYDAADSSLADAAVKEFKSRIKGFAKDIAEKYIDVPNTTEFAIMFLPTEGLYTEAVRCGMVEELQKQKINIAGPTTMAALLNSLQMGFRTLAIQKKSGQVWKVLEEVKAEFSKFGDVLQKTQNNMRKASEELDRLIGTRTNAINRKLRDVGELPRELSKDISQ